MKSSIHVGSLRLYTVVQTKIVKRVNISAKRNASQTPVDFSGFIKATANTSVKTNDSKIQISDAILEFFVP